MFKSWVKDKPLKPYPVSEPCDWHGRCKAVWNEVLWFLSMVVAGLAGCLLGSALNFCFGYLEGLVLRLLFGSFITNLLNTVFHTAWFTPGVLPLIWAILVVMKGCLAIPAKNKKDQE